MLKLANHTYEVHALVDGWQVTKLIESKTELNAYEIAKKAREQLEGKSVKLIGFRTKIY